MIVASTLAVGSLLVFAGIHIASAASSFFGGAAFGPGHVILTSDLSDNPGNTANDFSGIAFDDANGVPLASLATLATEYNVTDDDCLAGSPRFQVRLDMDSDGLDTGADKNLFVYIGPFPSFSGCTPDTWVSTGNLIASPDLRFDTSQMIGGTFYDSFAGALALAGGKNILDISLVVDSGWGFVDEEQTVLVDDVTIAILQSTTYDFTLAPVTVTIVKYVDGVHADAANAESLAFPMDASWDAENIGAGSGSFALSTVGFNNPNPYEATTADMTALADYSASEDTSGGNVGASCAEGKPFALVGYTTGTTEALAASDTPTLTPPSLTDITEDMFIIVWNEDCTPQLTLDKIVVNDNIGTELESAWTLTATGPSLLSGPGAPGSEDVVSDQTFLPGTYDLSEVGPALYDASVWSCVGGTQTDDDTVVIAAGENVVCTITNDDSPVPPIPPPPANACATPTIAPAGYTLLNGTSGNDTVAIPPFTMFVGLGGNDIITAPDGNYIVCTGSGNDSITIGNGDFTIDAGNGNNIINTGNGVGFVSTAQANDKITTGDGVQTISAGNGNNTIITGNGDKTVTTGNAIDSITTGDGADVINAGGGINTVDAGSGDDTVTTGSGIDNIDGGPDFDTCSAGGGLNTVVNCEA